MGPDSKDIGPSKTPELSRKELIKEIKARGDNEPAALSSTNNIEIPKNYDPVILKEKEISRRTFLKQTRNILAGLAAGAGLGGLYGVATGSMNDRKIGPITPPPPNAEDILGGIKDDPKGKQVLDPSTGKYIKDTNQ